MAAVSGAVLITGARAPVALDLARSFAAAGFEAHLADSVPSAMAQLSHAPAGLHRYASPRRDQAGFRRDLARLVAAMDPVLIVPTCEEVFHLAAAAPALGLADRLFAPAFGTLRRLHGKGAFADLCAELGLTSPETRRLESVAAPNALAAERASLVFKPEYSRAGVRTLVRPSLEALAAVRPSPAEPWCAQRFVAGQEACFYAVAREGRLVAFAAYGPRWQLRGGASYAFEPLETAMGERLRAMAAVLAERVVIRGQFACDAVIDGDGRPWLIECNPRATSGVHLFQPAALAQAMLDGAEAAPIDRLRYLAPAMWIFGLPEAIVRGRLRQWRADLARGEDVIGAPADRAPVAGALVDSAAFQLAALAHGRPLAAEMTADIEWNGEPL